MRKSAVLLIGITLIGGSVFAAGTIVPAKDSCSVHAITAVNLTEGAVLHIGAVSHDSPLTLAAFTDCPVDTAGVGFSLDGSPNASALFSNAGGLYTVSASVLDLLGPGAHTLTVITGSRANPDAVLPPDIIHFSVVRDAAADANADGIPDDSFATLKADGDTWLASTPVEDTGATRQTAMVRWDGQASPAPGYVFAAVSDSVNLALHASAIAPRALLNASEIGILLVQAAPDMVTLLGVLESEVVGPDPAVLLANGLCVEASILVSSDGGAHFSEIDPARLAANPVPVHLAIEGANVAAAVHPAIYAYPTSVVMDPTHGDCVIAWSGHWNQEDILRTITMPSSIEADVTALSVFAPIDEAEAAPLVNVTLPAGGESYSFGMLGTGQHTDAMFTVRNLGGGTLAGKVTARAPFEIINDGTYRLATGQSKAIFVRFAPVTDGSYKSRVGFTGGGGFGVSVNGTGYSTPDPPSSCNATTGALAASPPPPGGDGLLLAICAAALMACGHRFTLRCRRH